MTSYEMEMLLLSLKSRTQIKPDGPKLLTISFIDSDPLRARNVTEALITTYIEMNLGHFREDIDSAQQFLDSQIVKYDKQLQGAEEQLATFKQNKLNNKKATNIAAVATRFLNTNHLFSTTKATISF